MSLYPGSLEALIEQFARLPGVGRKSAQRYAFALLSLPDNGMLAFANAVTEAHDKLRRCQRCQNLADDEVCRLCLNPGRDKGLLCVVSEPQDVEALERAREYKGLYYVLHGVIAPSRGIGPFELNLEGLRARVTEEVSEVILALNPDTEGETTALYIARLLRGSSVRVTGLASGIPMGAHLKFADEVTLARSLAGRREL